MSWIYSNEYSGSVVIPSSVTYQGATYSVTRIGDGAFYDCSSLTSVTIPNSVKSIGDYAFERCYYLTSVTIPESVTSIGNRAFYSCHYLTSVTIHESVTSIGNRAFYGCIYLTSVTINSDAIVNKQYSSDFNLSHIFGSIIEFIIGESVKSIGDYAFCDCSSLTSVTIGESVKSIGEYAFRACSSLTSVTIPNSVTSIGERAFFWCSSLTSLTIPNSVTRIGDGAFLGCSSLTSVTIPNSVTRIGDDTFHFCSSLTSITIPNRVKSIGDYAFYGCSSLTSVTIPNSVTSIGSVAFERCSSLTSITIPNKVTSIGDDTFRYCFSLTSITIPNSVTSIGNSAFEHCSSLTSVTIPESVTSIGWQAFEGCSSLNSITCEAETPPTVGQYAFDDVSTSIPVYVPCESIQSYREHNQWGRFQNLQCVKPEQPETGIEIKNLKYADAVYVEDAEYGDYWEFVLYNDYDYDAEDYVYPELYVMVNEAYSKTAINGTYNVLYSEYLPTAYDWIITDEVGTLTIKNVDSNGNYSFKGSFTANDGKTYTFNQTVEVYAYSYAEEDGVPVYEEIILNEGGTNGSTTSVENTNNPSPTTNCQKIIRNGQLLILRDDKTYNIVGQIVE